MLLGDVLVQNANDSGITKEVIVNVAYTVTNYVYIKEVPISEGWSTDTWIYFWGVIVTYIAVLVALFGEDLKKWRESVKVVIDEKSIIKRIEPREHGVINSKKFKFSHPVINFYIDVLKIKGKSSVINCQTQIININKKINNKIIKVDNIGEMFLQWNTILNNKLQMSFDRRNKLVISYYMDYDNRYYFRPLVATSNMIENVHCSINETIIYELKISADNLKKDITYFV